MIALLEFREDNNFWSGHTNLGPVIEAIFFDSRDWFKTNDRRYIFLNEAKKLGSDRLSASGKCWLMLVNGSFYMMRFPDDCQFYKGFPYKLYGTYPLLKKRRMSKTSVFLEFNEIQSFLGA